MKKNALIISQIIFICVTPVAIIYFGSLPFVYQAVIFGIYTLFTIFLLVSEHWTLKMLGVRVDNLKKVALPYIIFTALAITVLLLVAAWLEKEPIDAWYTHTPLMLMFIPSSVTQEFLYRGFLINKLKRLHISIFLVILINTILFTLLHVIYDQKAIVLPLIFASGIGFAWMFYKYPNLIAVSASHAVLNLVAIIYTFF